MRIAILGVPASWYAKDLQRAAQPRHEVIVVPFGSLQTQISGERQITMAGGVTLDDCDCVIVRSMPLGTLEQVVFRMNALARLEAQGTTVINSPGALEVAIDKYLSLARLQSAGFSVPATRCCQTAEQALQAFHELGGDVVVKPLFGSEGRGITRISDPELAVRAFKMLSQLGSVIYLQQFIHHDGSDLRLFVLGNEVFGMRRSAQNDWRTNVSLGGIASPLTITEELRLMAHRAADCVQARICAVDFLWGNNGKLYALEVNAVPGWRALSRTLAVDISVKFINYLEVVADPTSGR